MSALTAADWWAMFGHFLVLSMLSIGGALATSSEMHRFLVEQRGWLTDEQFSASIALAQAAPGPNLLFVPVLGHAVAGLPGAFVALTGMLIPSTALALLAGRWGERRRQTLGVRAFVAGLAPVAIGLLLAAGTVLSAPLVHARPTGLLVVAAAALLSWRTKIGPLWLIAGGGLVGALGGV